MRSSEVRPSIRPQGHKSKELLRNLSNVRKVATDSLLARLEWLDVFVPNLGSPRVSPPKTRTFLSTHHICNLFDFSSTLLAPPLPLADCLLSRGCLRKYLSGISFSDPSQASLSFVSILGQLLQLTSDSDGISYFNNFGSVKQPIGDVEFQLVSLCTHPATLTIEEAFSLRVWACARSQSASTTSECTRCLRSPPAQRSQSSLHNSHVDFHNRKCGAPNVPAYIPGAPTPRLLSHSHTTGCGGATTPRHYLLFPLVVPELMLPRLLELFSLLIIRAPLRSSQCCWYLRCSSFFLFS